MYYINLICSRITNRMNNIFHAVCMLFTSFDIYIAFRQISYTRVLHQKKKKKKNLCDEESTPLARHTKNELTREQYLEHV